MDRLRATVTSQKEEQSRYGARRSSTSTEPSGKYDLSK